MTGSAARWAGRHAPFSFERALYLVYCHSCTPCDKGYMNILFARRAIQLSMSMLRVLAHFLSSLFRETGNAIHTF